MAEVPNKVYPGAKYGEQRANLFRASAGTYSGSALIFSGSIVLTGFKAQGTIHKYQPVLVSIETGSILYVSGSTEWAQNGILGVSNARVTEGANVEIIIRGVVPFVSSGATAITKGAPVIHAASGSITGSVGLCTVASIDTDSMTTGSQCIVGIALITGSAAAAQTCHVWVCPQVY